MRPATKLPTDKAQIQDVIHAFTSALRAKDARAAVAVYTRDATAFDLAPPLRIESKNLRDPDYIQQWFDTWKSPIISEPHDTAIVVAEDVAYALALIHMTGTKQDGEHVDLWFRSTMCFRRENGDWKIAHVHNSVPFAMDGSDRALLDLKP